jgi:GTPase SAR1 family protein
MLAQIAGLRAFASVTEPVRLAEMYVTSDQLAGLRGDDRPETQLMRALAQEAPPQRVQIVGATGAGKTSLILRVLGDLARRNLPGPPHEVLVVNVGDDPNRLSSPATFMRTIVQLVQLQGYRFATVDQSALRDAAADERIMVGRQVEHRLGLNAPVVSYSAGLREAYEQHRFGDNPARAREDFEDVLRTVSADYRPVVVIDDTEHFVATSNGQIDVESVHNLYHHAIRSLAEITIDLIVAVHHHYSEVAVVNEVAARYGFMRVDVASLPTERDRSGLALILQRRLQRNGIETDVADVVEPEALAQMQGLYFVNGHNLREVLDLADAAARGAHDERAERIAERHVQPLLNRRA